LKKGDRVLFTTPSKNDLYVVHGLTEAVGTVQKIGSRIEIKAVYMDDEYLIEVSSGFIKRKLDKDFYYSADCNKYSTKLFRDYELRIVVMIVFKDIGETQVQFYTTEPSYPKASLVLATLMTNNENVEDFNFESHYSAEDDKRTNEFLDNFLELVA
jgi:hypothetical protein